MGVTYKQLDFMRRETFLARLDEFSCYSYPEYCKAARKVLLKYGVQSFDEIPEMQLGRVFEDMRKALTMGKFRAFSRY
jgi:hypothetical protein